MIVDSDVLIEHLRGNARTRGWLEDQRSRGVRFRYSPVSRAELRAGARPRESKAIAFLFAGMEATAIGVATADLAGDLLARYFRSHRLELGDALIAATALELNDELATFNHKHFPGVKKLVMPDR